MLISENRKHLPTRPSDPPGDMEFIGSTSHKPIQAAQPANLSIGRLEECGRVVGAGALLSASAYLHLSTQIPRFILRTATA